MGGENKALMKWRDRSLVRHVHDRFAPQVDQLLLSSPRDLGLNTVKRVQDQRSGTLGPLAGFEAGLAHTQSAFLAVVPCDTPLIPGDLVIRLTRALEESAKEVAFVRSQGRDHPTICVISSKLRDGLSLFLDAGGRRVTDWMQTTDSVAVSFPDQQSAFHNCNSPADLAYLARTFSDTDPNDDN